MSSDPLIPETMAVQPEPAPPHAAQAKTAGLQLSPVETRVLGSLLEKERTTPEIYPLTLNSLVNACNQTSNRDPVVHYDERVVVHGLELLRQKKIALEVRSAGSRVEKFRHALSDHYQLNDAQSAVLCVLLLRGPQTLGELRNRTERLHLFADPEQVEACLQSLMPAPEPLVRIVPAGPGQKEHRYIQLLPAETKIKPAAASEKQATILVAESRLESMETAIQSLRQELESLRQDFVQFKKQFE